MKILAVSDEELPTIYSPNIRQRYRDIDVVVACGDLQFYYLEFIVTMLNKPLYYVLGNHDSAKQYLSEGRIATSAEGCIAIDGRTAFNRDNNLLLAGLGGSMRYKPKSKNQYTENEMWRQVLLLAPRLVLNRFVHGRYLDIFLSHASPAGIHDEDDGVHNGFQAFHWLLQRFKPRYHFHGHAHRYRRDKAMRTWVEQTEVINAHPFYTMEWQRPPKK